MDLVGFDEDRVLVPRPQSLLLDSKLGGRGDALFSPSMAAAEGLEHSSFSRSVAVRQLVEEDLEEKGERSDRVRTRTRPARRRRAAGRGRLTCGRGVSLAPSSPRSRAGPTPLLQSRLASLWRPAAVREPLRRLRVLFCYVLMPMCAWAMGWGPVGCGLWQCGL